MAKFDQITVKTGLCDSLRFDLGQRNQLWVLKKIPVNQSSSMKKTVIPIVAAAMTLTFTACQPTDKVAPAVMATDANELVSKVVDFLADPRNAGNSSGITIPNARPYPAKPSAAQIKAAFDAFDGDKSGQISSTELVQILVKAGVKDFDVDARKYAKEIDKEIKAKEIDDKVRQLIKMFDANNSGMMEFNEFERLIAESLKSNK